METPSHLKILLDRIEVPDLQDCGPAMRALNEKQRRYVCALGILGNHRTLAYQWAFGLTNVDSANANAPRLGAQQKIKDAIKEHYQGALHVMGPALSAQALLEVLGPSCTDLKLKLKAVELASNIVPGFKAATAHEITVKHEYSLADLEKKRIELERELGITSALPNPNIIDADFEVVMDSDGIEDLL